MFIVVCQQNYNDWSFAASTLWSTKMAGKREQVRALVHLGPLNCKAYGSRELPSFKEAVKVDRVRLYTDSLNIDNGHNRMPCPSQILEVKLVIVF